MSLKRAAVAVAEQEEHKLCNSSEEPPAANLTKLGNIRKGQVAEPAKNICISTSPYDALCMCVCVFFWINYDIFLALIELVMQQK